MKTRKTYVLALGAGLLLTTALAQPGGGQGFPGGPPPGGGSQGGPGGPRMFGGPMIGLEPLMGLVHRPDVIDELGLTDEQMEKIDVLMQNMRPPQGGPGFGPPGGQGQGPGEPPQGGQGFGPPGQPRQGGAGGPMNREAMEKLRKEQDVKVFAILTAAQGKRAQEIRIQLARATAVFDADVQKQLGITGDQKTKLDALLPKRGPGNPGGPPQGGPGVFGPPPGVGQGGPGEPPQGGPGGPPQGGPGGQGGFGPPPGGPGGLNDARRKELEKKIDEILTDSQKATLKTLGGKPFPRDRN